MNNADLTEIKVLYNLKCRLLTLERLAQSYVGEPKAIKLCLKFVKLETKTLNKCVGVNKIDLRELQRAYADLTEVLKGLLKNAANAESTLHLLADKTERQVHELNEQLNPISEGVRKIATSIDGTVHKLSAKLESGAQMLGEAIKNAVKSDE